MKEDVRESLLRHGLDKTPWPKQDAAGNNLSHIEACAWRFGGSCDCSCRHGKRLGGEHCKECQIAGFCDCQECRDHA